MTRIERPPRTVVFALVLLGISLLLSAAGASGNVDFMYMKQNFGLMMLCLVLAEEYLLPVILGVLIWFRINIARIIFIILYLFRIKIVFNTLVQAAGLLGSDFFTGLKAIIILMFPYIALALLFTGESDRWFKSGKTGGKADE